MASRRRLLALAMPVLARSLANPAAMDSEAEMLVGDVGMRPTKRNQRASENTDRTASSYMRNWHAGQFASDQCLPELNGVEEFSNPANVLPRQMEKGGKVFLVGDSVIGQICQLGSPGLCCSSQRPCNEPAFPYSMMSPHEKQLDLEPGYAGKGWQHLFEFKLRDGFLPSKHTAYFVAPEVHDEPGSVNTSVDLVTNFMKEKGTSEEDVLVLGMIGTHYNHGLEVFDNFVTRLIKKVANPFPGRVILLGYGPQHFAGAGHYTGDVKACAPNPLPGENSMPRNSFRSAIFLRNVWAHLTHTRSRLVDFNSMLSPLWNCHRSLGDCTHWKDPVISFQAQLILDALEKVN